MLLSCVVLVVKLQQSRQKDDDVAALQKRLNFIMKEKKFISPLCTSSLARSRSLFFCCCADHYSIGIHMNCEGHSAVTNDIVAEEWI